ncbi:MAG: DNA/RNA non-specific endonuclease [Bacteroidota bacterium]
MFRKLLWVVAVTVFISSCQKDKLIEKNFQSPIENINAGLRISTGFPETFESGTKTSYSNGTVTLSTGSWYFENAQIGTSSSDHKNGSKAARIQSTGKLTMNFNMPNGATQVTVYSAKYGSETSSTWELWQSINDGTNWTKVGTTTVTTSSTTLSATVFQVNVTTPIRFQIRKLTGGKFNIDDITIEEVGEAATRDDNLAMGNPSGAVTDVNVPNNYLLVKPQYVLSFNNSLGEPNWVSWHLSSAWKGPVPRCNCFSPDNQLPTNFIHVTTSNYTGSGFDRGHMCPSEDRDGTSTDNAATFLMSNIVPQAPNNNQQTWVNLENYSRTLMDAGNELYIISGGYGSGGTGSLGGITYTIDNGLINVPAHVWKVVLVLPIGSNDVTRVSSATRVIAVDMPNTQTVNSQPWGNYRVSVDQLEAITGFDFLNNVSVTVQSTIESTVDSGPTQ